MTVQFKSQSEKKGYSDTENVKTSTFAANEQNKSTSPSTKKSSLKYGDHKIRMCTKFKQQAVNKRYETLRKYKLCFCFLNSHLMKDSKSDRVCGVNGSTKKHSKLLHSDSPKTEKDKKLEEPLSQNRAGGSSSHKLECRWQSLRFYKIERNLFLFEHFAGYNSLDGWCQGHSWSRCVSPDQTSWI